MSPNILPDIPSDNRAFSHFDISNNQIGWLAHPEWSDMGQSGSWRNERYRHIDGRKQNDKPEGVEFKPLGVIALANAIPGMEALTSLNLSSNYLMAEGAKIVAEAIKVAVRLRLFWYNLYSYLTCRSTAAVCRYPQDHGAISQFTFSSGGYNSKPVTMETSMVEADFSGKVLGVSGAIMVGAFLPKCT
jgi:hypothetical protein